MAMTVMIGGPQGAEWLVIAALLVPLVLIADVVVTIARRR